MNIAMFQEIPAYPSHLEGMSVIFGIIGLSVIAFSRGGGMLFIGMLVSLLAPTILQDGYHRGIEKQFVLERFESGDTIECKVYRGEHRRLSQERGWYREDENFVRGEEVFSDPLLCQVIGKESPKPILWLNWIFYALFLLIAFSGRAWMSDRRQHEKNIEKIIKKD